MGIVEISSSVEKTSNNMSVVTESEKKRLSSLKQKKEAFKTKEQLVRDALSNIDNKARKNKIIFDENIDIPESPKEKKKKHMTLFNDDDDNNELETFPEEHDFKIKKPFNEKLAKLQMNYANDERFILDERFIEDDDDGNNEVQDENNDEANGDSLDVANEKDWQLNILENVLGVPIKKKDEKIVKPIKTSKMIRYDPTESEHQKYEIKVEEVKPKTKAKKKAKQKEIEEVEEIKPVPVCKDVYYSVSDKFTESFKPQETGFSLLKTFGQEQTSTRNEDYSAPDVQPSKDKKFKFSFDEKNPFKYDSSDDEDETEKLDNKKQEWNETANLDDACTTNESFFFKDNDPRFNDAFKFFNKEITSDGFSNLRRELKQIVRAKIRNNMKRSQQWMKKGKITKPTKRKSSKK